MENTSHKLQIGTVIAEYKITKHLGEGGFGITYLAEDQSLLKLVVIKEYFPAEMTLRENTNASVMAKSGADGNYQFGLEKFLEEGRVLAQFKHPNIVGVNRFIEANNTAYLIMDYEVGEDLSDYLKRTGFSGGMPETELKGYLVPILNGLQAVHDKGLLHRDVKPGNIYLRKDTEPMLIDFGAARYALGEHSKSMSAIISMGYAPPEQYSSKAKQSPASDLYAWGATAYELITGKPPVESPDRSNAIFEEESDPLKPLSQNHKDKYSKTLLTVIDQCLNIPQKKRPKSATEVLAMLTGEKTSTRTVKVNPKDRFKNDHGHPEQLKQNTHHSEGAKRLRDSHHASNQPKEKTNTLIYTLIILLLAGIGTASYFGYDYYTEKQKIAEAQHIAAAQEQQKQQEQLKQKKLQQAKLKAEREEKQNWSIAEQTDTVSAYQEYLNIYPDGKHRDIAENKIKLIKEQSKTTRHAGDTFRDCKFCPEMIVIPEGKFTMGDNNKSTESPEREVIVQTFAMSVAEININQFNDFVKASNYITDAEANKGSELGCYLFIDEDNIGYISNNNWRSNSKIQSDEHPVICISWNDAKAYIQWISNITESNYRLPSEAEWEYAARANSNTSYGWGNDIDCTKANYGQWLYKPCGNSKNTTPVKSFQANKFGLYDMHGNVWEWTEDCWHEDYNNAPLNGKAWVTTCSDENRKVLRGGSWVDTPAFLKTSRRYRAAKTDRADGYGFRIVKDL